MCRVPLTKGYFALVDTEDFERLSKLKWQAWVDPRRPTRIYARHAFKFGRSTSFVWMHREILGVKDSRKLVDHRNHDGLDNRRANLRVCTNRQNQQHQLSARQRAGRFKGVTPKSTGWAASIRAGEVEADGRRALLRLGIFTTAESAARAYDRAARKHFGEFASLNFPERAA